MINGILGRKIGMTQIFTEDGTRIPVTVVEAGPVTVVQIKTKAKEGHDGVQVGFIPQPKEKKVNKPMRGHFKDVPPTKTLREFRVSGTEDIEVGQIIDCTIFTEGEKVDLTGKSKGKGFQGVVKRYGFKGGPASHGSQFHRGTGSIGNSASPGRVFRGKRMPGRMGGKRVTIKNLTICKVLPEKNLLLIKGAIPSHNGAVVMIRKVATPA